MRIIFHIEIVMRGSDLGAGFRSRMLRAGGSVARARAAIVSWKRLIHISSTAVRTDCSSELATAETKMSITQVMPTVT
jgi:hypothetical protein